MADASVAEDKVAAQLRALQRSLASHLAEASLLLEGHFEEHRSVLSQLEAAKAEIRQLRGRSLSSERRKQPSMAAMLPLDLSEARRVSLPGEAPEETAPEPPGPAPPPPAKRKFPPPPPPPPAAPARLHGGTGDCPSTPLQTLRGATPECHTPPSLEDPSEFQGKAPAPAAPAAAAAPARPPSAGDVAAALGSKLRTSALHSLREEMEDVTKGLAAPPPARLKQHATFEDLAPTSSSSEDDEDEEDDEDGILPRSLPGRRPTKKKKKKGRAASPRSPGLPHSLDSSHSSKVTDASPREERQRKLQVRSASIVSKLVRSGSSNNLSRSKSRELSHSAISGKWMDCSGAAFGGKVMHLFADGWFLDEDESSEFKHALEPSAVDKRITVLSYPGPGGSVQKYFVQELMSAVGRALLLTGPGLQTGVELQFVGPHTRRLAPEVVDEYSLLTEWVRVLEMTDLEASMTTGRKQTAIINNTISFDKSDLEEQEMLASKQHGGNASHPYTIHPFSVRRAIWDLLSFVLVLWDVLLIPLQAFEPEETAFLKVVAHFTRVFWTVDLFLAFFRGYVLASGELELRLSMAFQNYAKTWFLCDLTMVIVDWVEIFFQGNALGFAQIGRASRTVRIFRVVRLLRVLRMREVMSFILECVSSQKIVIFIDIAKLIVFIVVLSHFLACTWYAVGAKYLNQMDTWIVSYGFENAPLLDRYFISLHWSLSQFAGGMDEVTPENLYERLLAVLFALLGFVASTAFVSSLTSSITQVMIIGGGNSQQQAALREYLIQNGVSRRLMMRAQRNAAHALREQARCMPEDNVTLLKSISEPLRIELHYEMYAPTLRLHSFFNVFAHECPHIMGRVCHQACGRLLVSQGDVVFYGGENPTVPKMYFVESGALQYVGLHGPLPVPSGRWLSEAVLWTQHWEHRGSLMAVSQCRLCTLGAAEFQDVVLSFGAAAAMPARQGRLFLEYLNSLAPTDVDDLSDLPVDDTLDIVTSMSISDSASPEGRSGPAGLLYTRTSQVLGQLRGRLSSLVGRRSRVRPARGSARPRQSRMSAATS